MTASPVWSSFGGNGVPEASSHAILKGYCVVDGPFANLTLSCLDAVYHPHFLYRGFASGDLLHNLSTSLGPENIEELLSLEHYERFNLGVEHSRIMRFHAVSAETSPC